MQAFIEAAIALAPKLIAFGIDEAPLVAKLLAMFKSGTEPTDQDWIDLAALEKPLRDQLQTPLPPDPDGTTET